MFCDSSIGALRKSIGNNSGIFFIYSIFRIWQTVKIENLIPGVYYEINNTDGE